MHKVDLRKQAADAVERILKELGIAFHVVAPKTDTVWDIEVHLPEHSRRLCLEWRHSLAPNQLDSLKERLVASLPTDAHPGLVVHRLSQGLLDRCRDLDLFAFDFAGNGYLRIPGIYFERCKPAPVPMRQPSAGTGFTGKASRLVRALLAQVSRRPARPLPRPY